jgi:hypothetical protein
MHLISKGCTLGYFANKNPAQITEGLSRVKLLMDTEYRNTVLFL